MQSVPVEILLTKKERQEFRIAVIEEGSSMRRVGRQLIRDWLKARRSMDTNAR